VIVSELWAQAVATNPLCTAARGAGSLLKLVEPTGRGVWERESPSAVEMDPTSAHFDDTFRECLLAKIGPLICCHFVLLLRVVCVCAQKIGSV